MFSAAWMIRTTRDLEADSGSICIAGLAVSGPASSMHVQGPERFHQTHHCRANRHQEERWEQAQGEWKDHLSADLRGRFLGCLHALVTELFRVDTQCISDTGTEAKGLDQECNQSADVIQPSSLSKILQRQGALHPCAHFCIHERQLVTQLGIADHQVVGDPLQGRSEAEAGLDAYDQQVECIGKGYAEFALPGFDTAIEPHTWNDASKNSRHEGHSEQLAAGDLGKEWRGEEYTKWQGEHEQHSRCIVQRQCCWRTQARVGQQLADSRALTLF